MKRRLTILSATAVLVLTVIGVAGYRSYFVADTSQAPYTLPTRPSDTLRIAYIGDSWAFYHRPYDAETSDMLTERLHRPARFRSYGICGLTSNEIYQQLFCNDSLRQFLASGTDVCIVSAGINDSYKKMPTPYYTQSIDAIVRFLLHNHIYPIIQEIPDYDIVKAYERQTPSRKALRQLSMLIHQLPTDCKQLYREALDSLVIKQGYATAIGILRYQDWNSQYSLQLRQLYQSDGMHLNPTGYAKLDSCMAAAIGQAVFRKKP